MMKHTASLSVIAVLGILGYGAGSWFATFTNTSKSNRATQTIVTRSIDYPGSFTAAKKKARDKIYFDRKITFYCGCTFVPTGTSGGGKLNAQSCGYIPENETIRSHRIEWEHVLPAYELRKHLACQNTGHPTCTRRDGTAYKGRKCCNKVNEDYAKAERDLHNLVPVIGELNGDRSHFHYGEIEGEERAYGECDFEVDQTANIAEVSDSVKGNVARIWFYMRDTYGIALDEETTSLLQSWDRLDPVDVGEKTRDRRIEAIQGNFNPYVRR